MKLAYAVLLFRVLTHGSRMVHRGLNLPPMQGQTSDGAFYQGLYRYDYKTEQVAHATKLAGFDSLRLAVNIESANNDTFLLDHKAYLDSVGGRGIICLFETSSDPLRASSRIGKATGAVREIAQAWKNVHRVFEPYNDSVLYEIFNEPWGYGTDSVTYLRDMRSIIRKAGLPENRVVLAGLHGSADVQSVARAGWNGYLAYHVYTYWLPEGQRTRDNFARRIQHDLGKLGPRVFITEFGGDLDGRQGNVDKEDVAKDVMRHLDGASMTSDWHEEDPEEAIADTICLKYPDNEWCKKYVSFAQKPRAKQKPYMSARKNDTIAFLGGLRDALLEMKARGEGIRGLFHWHGWHNGDNWDFWDAANAKNSRMIQMIMMDHAGSLSSNAPNASKASDYDPFLFDDILRDDDLLHMEAVHKLATKSVTTCPIECSSKVCKPGDGTLIGGRLLTPSLTGTHCIHNCSKPYGGTRYCGAGAGYSEGNAVDCGGCAHPRMCSGLPCWTVKNAAKRTHQPIFLHRSRS